MHEFILHGRIPFDSPPIGRYVALHLSEVIRGIIAQEQDHLIDLADALGEPAPQLD